MTDPHRIIPRYERRAAYVADRMPKVKALKAMVCRPTDDSQVPLGLEEVTRPPNVSDTLVQCAMCDEDCWMSDGQSRFAGLCFPLCFGCMVTASYLGLWNRNKTLDITAPPNRDNHPRILRQETP